jgi:hypothetical protein
MAAGQVGRVVEAEVLEEHYVALKAVLELNQSRIDSKAREPSNVFHLDPVTARAEAIATMVAAANEAAERYNETIRDLGNAKRRLTAEVWRFVVEERRTDLDTYADTTGITQRTIAGLQASITDKAARRTAKEVERRRIEESITSVRPTVDTINRILGSFGFSNFKLEVAGERNDMYRIVRLDGTDAARTLSEGERSFITFLYFYQCLAGSTSATGTSAARIVVFDDPVSSLDADVLFIVSALMHKLRGEAERRLRAWCTTEYGRFWLRSALEPGGVIRIKAGDPIPDFHMVAMRSGPKFVAPQERMRDGHRVVTVGTGDFRAGHPQQPHELVLERAIRLDLVTDPALVDAARTFDVDMPSSQVPEPSILFSASAHVLLAPTGWPKMAFVLYQHILAREAPTQSMATSTSASRLGSGRPVGPSTSARYVGAAVCCSTASCGRNSRPARDLHPS